MSTIFLGSNKITFFPRKQFHSRMWREEKCEELTGGTANNWRFLFRGRQKLVSFRSWRASRLAGSKKTTAAGPIKTSHPPFPLSPLPYFRLRGLFRRKVSEKREGGGGLNAFLSVWSELKEESVFLSPLPPGKSDHWMFSFFVSSRCAWIIPFYTAVSSFPAYAFIKYSVFSLFQTVKKDGFRYAAPGLFANVKCGRRFLCEIDWPRFKIFATWRLWKFVSDTRFLKKFPIHK